ncbi:histidine kinase [Actinoplanes sp. NBRC 103695]|uniref:sensor histidine kinase n=1 Tax=Actinoplanes sp. NBRC 103695 TaxID=3032202 RepID=UPI0024A53548|nr:histidine kinase [Actinoplanes sp. NBRC 103695]GLY99470.1 hypothetical protein Acsp02_67230 [Actinoplanes sp. NBRC 103695]
MTPRRIWLLPAALAVLQLAFWPGLPLARGEAVDPATAAAVAAITAGLAAALSWRRRAPVAVTAAAAVAVSLGAWVVPGQVFLAPGDAVTINTLTDLVALFSVAVLRSLRTTALVVAGLLVWQAGLIPALNGVTADYPADLALGAIVYTVVASAGRVRRRWVGDREAAAQRLADAERARHEAAGAERRRLARELHDVTAHHLTSIVVNASAAQFLADQRPDLRDEALAFASRTGRQAIDDLHRLVAVLPTAEETAAAPPAVADLADDFRRLGQVVTVEAADDPPPAAAEVLHAIAREALTNTLRYAPGGHVTLIQRYGPDGAHLVIEDDGAAGTSPATGLGGGRGLAGLRERAAALGGTVEAGPRAEGGWRVTATLPPVHVARPRRERPGGETVLDAGLMLLTLAVPLSSVAFLAEEGAEPAAVTLLLLAAVAHSAPLLWRRRHPRAVFAAVALTTWLLPILQLTGVVPNAGELILSSPGADVAAIYTAAVAVRPARSWLAPVVSLASTALAAALLLTVETPAEDLGGSRLDAALLFLLSTAFVAFLLVVPYGGALLAGYLVRRRRAQRHDREHGLVAVEGMRAEARARAERSRIAEGLRVAVLEHAARVPRAAEEADLPAVLDASKQALSAMRGLLDNLGPRLDTTDREVSSSPSV